MDAKPKLVVSGMSVSALALGAIVAIAARRSKHLLDPEMAAQVRELEHRLMVAEQSPNTNTAAKELREALHRLEVPGMRWHLWGFTKWELIRMRLNALADGRPSDEMLIALEGELERLEKEAELRGL